MIITNGSLVASSSLPLIPLGPHWMWASIPDPGKSLSLVRILPTGIDLQSLLAPVRRVIDANPNMGWSGVVTLVDLDDIYSSWEITTFYSNGVWNVKIEKPFNEINME